MVKQAPVDEPTVWVDPELYVEPPPVRFARGTVPPPSLVGAHCELDAEVSETDGAPLVVADD